MAQRIVGPGPRPDFALALGSGGARGLAHIGVLEVLEREGLAAGFVAGSSMGGLVGALHASGLSARELAHVARGCRFPWWFLPGGLLTLEQVCPAVRGLLPARFEDLPTPLAVTAVDIEAGCQLVLRSGDLVAAVRATCALPGVFPPEHLGGRWLVDGAVANGLPVDVAWMADPGLVVAVRVGGPRARSLPLRPPVAGMFARLGRVVPNPATAKLAFEVLARAAEISLERQTALCAAMTDPEVLIEPELGAMGLRDFDRWEGAVAAGRRATEAALPELIHLLDSRRDRGTESPATMRCECDPVCGMAVHPQRARATVVHEGVPVYFCSVNCRDRFLRTPGRYLTSLRRLEWSSTARTG